MLHIHNGESTAGTLREYGFPGEHFAFQEVLMAGPVPSGLSPDEWVTTRARYLSEAYDLNLGDCRNNLLKQEAVLRKTTLHDETVLWFEHDLFCQINLIYLLDRLSKQSPARATVSLICIGEFPGIYDFRGLGQLTGEQLVSLFEGRRQIGERELGLAAQAWAAYSSTDPRDILNLLDGDTSALPFLRDALLLHLYRFPSVVNGLGRIENKALDLISRGAIEFNPLFSKFANEESVYGLGDAQFWNELKRIGEGSNPLVTISGLEVQSRRYHQVSFELTAKGREVFCCTSDFIDLNGIDLWLGGVHLLDGGAVWCWDARHNQLTRARG